MQTFNVIYQIASNTKTREPEWCVSPTMTTRLEAICIAMAIEAAGLRAIVQVSPQKSEGH